MRSRFNLDALGIATSLACAIHCAILPMILSTLPIFGINLVGNIGFEYIMIFLAFCIGAYSLWHGYRKHHHNFIPLLIFSFGIILLLLKQVFHEYQGLILPFGVGLIIISHLLNFRSCRVHNHAHADDCNH